MARIALRAEQDIAYKKRFFANTERDCDDVTGAISHATCTTAYDLNAAAIVTVTKTGSTAKMVSRYRPSMPIIGCATDDRILRQLNLSWGVVPVHLEEKTNSDELFSHAVEEITRAGLVKNGDLVVITGGIPLGMSGTTNMLKVQIVGDVLVKGRGMNLLKACGNACVARNEREALENFKPGDILCVHSATNKMIDLIKKSSGLIAEEKGEDSHAAILGMALNIPVIIGAAGAVDILKSGTMLSIDAENGSVSAVQAQK